MQRDIADEKHLLRTKMMERRKAAYLADDRERKISAAGAKMSKLLARQFVDRLCAQCLAGYMPMRTEIDPLAVMAAHTGSVCVPVIAGKGMALEFHRWTVTTPMVEGRFKALIPTQHDPLVPDILIVPLLAFDRRGYRLGYGGGFYDRTLATLRRSGQAFAVGFAFAEQEIDVVPINATDQALDVIVTPDDLIVPDRARIAGHSIR